MRKIEEKIKSQEELVKILEKLRKTGKKIVLCHGVFDLVHPGHIFHFEEAKKEGDVLVVSITADKFVKKAPDRPFFPQEIRAKNLAALEMVDFVTIDPHFSAVEIIKKLKPDVYFKGQEYEKALNDSSRNFFKEVQAIKSVGGEVKFSHTFTLSSSSLLKEYLNVYPKETKDFLEKFAQKFKAEKIIEKLREARDLKILVIGEAIIDEYCYCKGMGKVPKENLVATKFLEKERFPGGVLASANHLASFSHNVHLVTVLGKKESFEDFIRQKLNLNLNFKFFFDKERQTIVKTRFIDPTFFVKMFEIYYFEDKPLSQKLSAKISSYLKKILSSFDLVIVNDYGHGFFVKEIIQTLEKKAKFLAVNTQTNSANFGFNLITKYKRADYICIDEVEARLALHQKEGDIFEIIKELFRKIRAKKIAITRGHLGCVGMEKNGKKTIVPVLSTKVVDRLGAGDAFFVISSLLAVRNLPIEVICFVGNVAGAIQVANIGNKEPIFSESLYKFIQTLLK